MAKSRKKEATRILQLRKLFPEWYDNESKVRSKSVMTPSAQSVTPSDPGTQSAEILNRVFSQQDEIMKRCPGLWYVIEILISGGVRVSEVLDIEPWHITRTGHVVIRGKKGSNDRVVKVTDAKEYLLNCSKNGMKPFLDFDRYFVYREFRKLGIEIVTSNSSKKAVTHAFRHILASEVQEKGKSVSTTARVLGHKSKKSTKHYGVKKKSEIKAEKGDNRKK